MLYDRSYMRAGWSSVRESATLALIAVLVVAFVFQSCLMFFAGLPVEEWLALSWHGLAAGRVWQLVTFQFLHATPFPFHLLFNCLGLYFLGRALEPHMGTRPLLKLYMIAGLGGGILQVLSARLLPFHADIGVVGASAGVMGLLGAFAALFPSQQITLWVLVFPINIRALHLFWFSLFLSAYGTLVPFGDVAHGAHLGGLLAGAACMRWGLHEKTFSLAWLRPPARKPARKIVPFAAPKASGPKGAPVKAAAPAGRKGPARPGSGDFMSVEVDPILDKISAYGIHSLTAEERRVLERARERMGRK